MNENCTIETSCEILKKEIASETKVEVPVIYEGGGSTPNAVLYTQQTLTPEQQNQARTNIDAQRSLTAGENITITPEGTISAAGGGGGGDKEALFRDMWNEACKQWYYNISYEVLGQANDDGTYTLNGCTFDYVTAIKIWNLRQWNIGIRTIYMTSVNRQYTEVPTMFPYGIDVNNAIDLKDYYYGVKCEALYIFGQATSIQNIVRNAANLVRIDGCITMYGTAATAYADAFTGCAKLESVSVKNIKANFSFQYNPNINNATILYVIQNATPTTAITITLHPDAFARASADADITNALALQELITLASA